MRNMYSLFCQVLTSLSLLPLAGTAAYADHHWNELVSLEVLDGGPIEPGRLRAALHLKLADGWKTYWRAPGDAGIPPHFSWAGSRNVADVRIIWPTPEVFDTAGMRTIGYKGEMVLPIEITLKSATKPTRLKGQMQIGLCEDICIPAELDFDHRVNPQAGRNPAIVAALANRPYSARDANVSDVSCHMNPTRYGMKVTARIQMPSIGGSELAVIETETPQLMATETRSWREGGALVAETELLSTTTDTAIMVDRSALRFTVLGASHAVDIRGCSAGS